MQLPADIESTAIGSSFEFHMEPLLESENKNLWELQIFRGVELMGKFSIQRGSYHPMLRIEQGSDIESVASVMVHGSFITVC